MLPLWLKMSLRNAEFVTCTGFNHKTHAEIF